MITPDEKRILQKEIAQISKEFRGAGPNCHSITVLDNELHILISGTLTPIEKYLFSTYGQDYFNAIYKFYYETVERAVKRLDDSLHNKYRFKLLIWEPDFLQDRMKYIIQCNHESVV